MSDTQNIELLYPRPSCLIEGLGGGGEVQVIRVKMSGKLEGWLISVGGGGRAYDRGYSFLLQVDWPPRGYSGH